MTNSNPSNSSLVNQVVSLTASKARSAIDQNTAVLIDVREPFERSAAFIPGSYPVPLSSIDAVELATSYPKQQIIFQCRSGARSADAAGRFIQANPTREVASLAGGIDAWRAAGLAVERSTNAPKIDIMRQVQMIAGGLVLVGVLLGAFAHPAFLIVSGFVGSGLLFAGASGWCGMAMLLGKMPWNRVTGQASQTADDTAGACCSR